MYYKLLKKTQLKLDREIRHNRFLKTCKSYKITPNFIKIRNKHLWNYFKPEVIKFEKKILNIVIRRRYGKIKHLKEEIDRITNDLKGITMKNQHCLEMEKLNKIRDIERKQHEYKLNKKLKFWIHKYSNKQDSNQYGKTNIDQYVNMSNHTFNEEERRILNLGPKYILRNKINLKDAIPKIEETLEDIPENEAIRIRNIAQNEIEKINKNPIKNDNNDKWKTIKTLKKKNDLTYLHTDKTGKLAIMDKNDYIQKMEEAIKLMDTEEIKKDPNTKISNKVNNLTRDGKWPDNKKPYKKNFTPNTPIIFGKLKDHKNPPKMRPIVNKRVSPTYDLEIYMKDIYKKLLPPSIHSISSNNEFLQILSNYKPTKDTQMFSLDVESLYPSIDINEMTDIVNQEIKKTYNEIPIQNTLQSATNLILNENYFKFNEKIYQQKKGVPMGSPIANIIAEWKMRILEEEIIVKNPDLFKLWIRYVDDIFVITEKHIDFPHLIQTINTYDKNIKFTYDIEKANTLPFLDIKIIREDNLFKTTVYRKPNINFNIIPITSNTPFPYKISGIRSYINRALKICSTKQLLHDELNLIRYNAQAGGYTKKTIERLIQKTIKSYNNIQSTQKTLKFNKAIPYMTGISLKIKKELKKLNVEIPIKPDRNLFQILRTDTEPTNPLETAGIYRLNFESEGGVKKTYVGMTKRKINERLKEHYRDIRLNKDTTAIAKYNTISPININSIQTEKIANYNNIKYALTREAIEIITDDLSCNQTVHSEIDNRWQFMLKRRSNERR